MDKHKWIRNSFVDNAIAPQKFTSLEAELFIDLPFDLTLKSVYSSDPLTSFRIKAQFKCCLVSCNVLRILIPFTTSYLCEAGFFDDSTVDRTTLYRNDI